MDHAKLLCAFTIAFGLGGCVQQADVPDPPAASGIGDGYGYHAEDTGRQPGREPALPHTYVVLAFSGGGTRAAAFDHGALRELGATPSPSPADLSLLDAVDMISSTSGGSVAAANFALRGPAGYRGLDAPDGFLQHDGMTGLIAGVLDPFDMLERAVTPKSRIQLLSAWFRPGVFGNADFDTLKQQRSRHPPLLILNAADMATGEGFPFVQRQLDRLCLDLGKIALADAVAASAAFPIALTPMRLPDRSPCPPQFSGQGGRLIDHAVQEAGASRAELEATCRNPPALDTSPAAFRQRGRRQYPLLNLDDCGQPRAPDDPARIRYVHLLDGGIADNVGLSEPLETLTDVGDDKRVKRAILDRSISKVVVIAVNARSQPSTSIGRDASTPGILAMANGVISAAIDGRSTGLFAQLDTLSSLLKATYGAGAPEVVTLPVDFELIHDPKCRARFQAIATNWSLGATEVAALQEMALAILRASPGYLSLAGAPQGDPALGQDRAARACRRLAGAPEPPARFGAE